jgi:hypothetical protein
VSRRTPNLDCSHEEGANAPTNPTTRARASPRGLYDDRQAKPNAERDRNPEQHADRDGESHTEFDRRR